MLLAVPNSFDDKVTVITVPYSQTITVTGAHCNPIYVIATIAIKGNMILF
jgi:hypothetical protein